MNSCFYTSVPFAFNQRNRPLYRLRQLLARSVPDPSGISKVFANLTQFLVLLPLRNKKSIMAPVLLIVLSACLAHTNSLPADSYRGTGWGKFYLNSTNI